MNFDVLMPSVLSLVMLASLALNSKTEAKLKTTLEEKRFGVRDGILLVGLIVVMVSLIAFFRESVAPLMILFLFSYSMLLFVFTYVFSNKRWYLGIISAMIFVFLYAAFRGSELWSYYLINIYAVTFAILITLYIANLFTWKATVVFALLLTGVDIVMVLVTGWMIEAATVATSLDLPMLVTLPIIPLLFTETGHLAMMGLGVGDFFFSGLLAIQTLKKHSKRSAIIAIIAMGVSFFIGEFLLINYIRRPFPATLFIIPGWLVFALMLYVKEKFMR